MTTWQERLGLATPEQRELLRSTRIQNAGWNLALYAKGDLGHGVDEKATAKRRAANKRARAQRKASR